MLIFKAEYGELLVSGKKTIELRKWNTNFRGKFLIHASKNVNKERCKSLGIDHTKLKTGAIIGRAVLYDVKKYDNKAQFMRDRNRHYADMSIFDSRLYGFMIRNGQRLRQPIQYSGKLGFFEVNDSLLKV